MTQYTTVTLIPGTTYGTPSGNYDGSSQDWLGNAVPAANYYGGQGALQTITYRLQNFEGNFVIEATLNDTPDGVSWFEVDRYGDGSSIVTITHPVSVIGNFAWIRARVENFSSGTILNVTAAY